MAETETQEEAPSPEEPAKPEKHRKPIIPALIFLAIIGGAAYLFVIRSKPEQAVRRLIDYQLKLSEAQVGEKLYDDTLSLRMKQSCPRDDFIGAVAQTPPDFWHLARYKNLHIKVEGNKAIVTYVVTYNGVTVDRATEADPDVYTKATKTVLGRLITVKEALALIDAQNNTAIGSLFGGPKEYQDARKKAIKEGDHRLVIEKAGQWYDAPDSHSGCGG
jgi:hypothetical protein